MRRALKLLAALLMVIVVAAVVVVALLPTERIAGLVAERVTAATGRNFTIAGGAAPSFFPVLGVQTGPVALANAAWAEAPQMMTASAARVGVEIIPLLSGVVRIAEVRLIDPMIALEVNQEGVGNWAFEAGAAAPSFPPSGEETGGGGFVKEIALAEAVIENGALSFADRRTGTTIALDAIDATVTMEAPDKPLTVAGSAVWNGEAATLDLTVATPATARAGAETGLTLVLAAAPLTLSYEGAVTPPSGGAPAQARGAFSLAAPDPAAAAAWATGQAAPDALAGLTDLSLGGDIATSVDAATLTATGAATRGGETVTASLKASGGAGWAESRAFDVDLEANLGALASVRYVGAVAPFEGALPVALSGRYDISAASPDAAAIWATGASSENLAGLSDLALAGRIDHSAKGLSATAKGGVSRGGVRAAVDLRAESGADGAARRAFAVTLNGALSGSPVGSRDGSRDGSRGDLATLGFRGDVAAPPGGAPALDGALTFAAPDLRGLAAFAGASLPEARGVYRSLFVTGDVAIRDGAATLDATSLRFDDIAASGAIDATFGAPVRVNADLTAGDLDLRPYVQDQSQGDGGGDGSSDPGWSREPIDLTGLGALDGKVAIRADAVLLPRLTLGESDITATLKGGALDLKIRELGLYGGGLKGDIAVDGTAGNAVRADIFASAVRLLPMLAALADMRSVEGRGRFDLNVAGRGASLRDIMDSLDGSGAVKLTDGALVGYNLAAMVRNAASAFTGAGGEQKTDFSEVSGTFRVTDGVLSTADFSFLGPLIRIAGQGQVDLGGQTMQFRLVPKAVATLKGQGGALTERGLAFPVIVSGPWASLTFRPDLQAGISNLLKDPDAAVDAIKDAVKGVKAGGAKARARNALEALSGGGGAKPPSANDLLTGPPSRPSDRPEKAVKGLLKGLFGD